MKAKKEKKASLQSRHEFNKISITLTALLLSLTFQSFSRLKHIAKRFITIYFPRKKRLSCRQWQNNIPSSRTNLLESIFVHGKEAYSKDESSENGGASDGCRSNFSFINFAVVGCDAVCSSKLCHQSQSLSKIRFKWRGIFQFRARRRESLSSDDKFSMQHMFAGEKKGNKWNINFVR